MISANLGLVATQPMVSEEEENPLAQEILSLDWHFTGTCKLPASHSTLSIPESYMAVTGNDAAKFSTLCENNPENVEAIIVNNSFEHMIVFQNHEEGYVTIDDWKNLDPTEMLESIIEATEKANQTRRQNGTGLHVLGWLQEPTLDRNTNTIYWAIEAKSDAESEHAFNSTAIRLGRKGYERVVWVGSLPEYKVFGGELDVMLRAHSFDPGYRYKDYTTGDKVAAYGITTLVAATAGAKIARRAALPHWLYCLKSLAASLLQE